MTTHDLIVKAASAPTMIRKSTPVEIKIVDEAQGIVEALVNSVGVIDYDDEILASGSFNASIAVGLPAVAWFHDQKVIVGGVLAAEERDGKLWARMQFDLDTEVGSYAFKMVQRGRVREWSVGFRAIEAHVEKRDGKVVRIFDTVEWIEVSPVLRGASPNTSTVSAKAADTDAPITELKARPDEAKSHAGSFEAVQQALHHALNQRLFGSVDPYFDHAGGYVYIEATYDDHCVACVVSDDGCTYWQIPYMLDLDGAPVLGTPTEVTSVFVPVTSSGEQALAADTAPATSPDAAGTEQDAAFTLLTMTALRLGIDPPLRPKVGARNSTADMRRIQQVHDNAVELGATCAAE